MVLENIGTSVLVSENQVSFSSSCVFLILSCLKNDYIVIITHITSECICITVIVPSESLKILLRKVSCMCIYLWFVLFQLSELHHLMVEAAQTLKTQAPDLYVRQSPVPNAYTLAVSGKKPFVVVHTSLVELLTRKELQVLLISPSVMTDVVFTLSYSKSFSFFCFCQINPSFRYANVSMVLDEVFSYTTLSVSKYLSESNQFMIYLVHFLKV